LGLLLSAMLLPDWILRLCHFDPVSGTRCFAVDIADFAVYHFHLSMNTRPLFPAMNQQGPPAALCLAFRTQRGIYPVEHQPRSRGGCSQAFTPTTQHAYVPSLWARVVRARRCPLAVGLRHRVRLVARLACQSRVPVVRREQSAPTNCVRSGVAAS
jgi:hypothetical protein